MSLTSCLYAIIGLGNPGSKYAGTRHNVGFRVVEAIARSQGANRPSRHRWSLYSIARLSSDQLILVQPLTYMNRSGKAVAELLQIYPLQQENMLLIYDDLDLSPGTIRLRKRGGSGGHRGVQSIIELPGSIAINRLRIGIGRPPSDMSAADYVLQPPLPEEQALYAQTVELASEAALLFVRRGVDAAMNQYNRTLPT